MNRLMRLGRSAATVLAVGLLLAGCTLGPTETREDRFTVAGPVQLVADSQNGRIEVEAGPDNEVYVQATLRGADRLEYEVRQEGDTITVTSRRTRRVLFGFGAGTDLVITVPASTVVDLETSNGRIELTGIHGSGSLDTSNGKIILEDVVGDFVGDTSNGSITIDGMEGSARLRTSNGGVDVQDVIGEFDIETSNGRIAFSGELLPGGRNRLDTSNGRVEVELQGIPSVNLDASTSHGDVTSELPILVTVMKEKELTGTIGNGEADLRIRTSNGDITIR
jgi:DUF4097 and DUF4098 domain-containing protein YvlB